MQWSPCSEAQCLPIECSGVYAAWPKASRWNAVDSMHCDWMQCNPCSEVKCIPIECSGFHAAWLNAVDSRQREEMEPNWMQGFYAALLNAVDSKSKIECSGLYAAWPKTSRLNALDSMQRHWMQRIPCIVAQWIQILCSGVHAARPNHPDWMLWIIWSMAQIIPTECSEFDAVWLIAV